MRPAGASYAGASYAGASYDSVSISFHWIVVALVLPQIVLGLMMGFLPENALPQAVSGAVSTLHKSIGVTILVLMVLRLAWRATHPAPALPSDVPRVQAVIARLNHTILYVILFVMPISGYLLTTAGGYPLPYFWLFQVPGVTGVNKPLGEYASAVHGYAQWLIYAFILLHVAGAAYHAYVRKDGVVRRILPGEEGAHGAAEARRA